MACVLRLIRWIGPVTGLVALGSSFVFSPSITTFKSRISGRNPGAVQRLKRISSRLSRRSTEMILIPGKREAERILGAVRDQVIADELMLPTTNAEPIADDLPSEPGELAKKVDFDMDKCIFLAYYAFQAYKDLGDVGWEIPGATIVRFKDAKSVSKIYPGLLTVVLLQAEGIPVARSATLSNGGGDGGELESYVTMGISDKDMSGEIKTSQKRPIAPKRFWGETSLLHVHDPESSMLQLDLGLWDPWSKSLSPAVSGGRKTVSTATVPLAKVLTRMTRNNEDSWTGWVDMDTTDGDREGDTNEDADRVAKNPIRIQVALSYRPMDDYQADDLPTAPRASDEVGVSALGAMASRLRELVGQSPDEDTDDRIGDVNAYRHIPKKDNGSAIAGVVTEGDQDNKESSWKWGWKREKARDSDGGCEEERDYGSGRTGPISAVGADGLPDWSVLTSQVGGMAKEMAGFDLMCCIDNPDTDTQIAIWRDEDAKRLVVGFRGTEENRWKDVLTDVNFLMDELDAVETTKAVLPIAVDGLAAVFNTTAGKKERVRPLAETLSEQKENLVQSLDVIFNKEEKRRNKDDKIDPVHPMETSQREAELETAGPKSPSQKVKDVFAKDDVDRDLLHPREAAEGDPSNDAGGLKSAVGKFLGRITVETGNVEGNTSTELTEEGQKDTVVERIVATVTDQPIDRTDSDALHAGERVQADVDPSDSDKNADAAVNLKDGMVGFSGVAGDSNALGTIARTVLGQSIPTPLPSPAEAVDANITPSKPIVESSAVSGTGEDEGNEGREVTDGGVLKAVVGALTGRLPLSPGANDSMPEPDTRLVCEDAKVDDACIKESEQAKEAGSTDRKQSSRLRHILGKVRGWSRNGGAPRTRKGDISTEPFVVADNVTIEADGDDDREEGMFGTLARVRQTAAEKIEELTVLQGLFNDTNPVDYEDMMQKINGTISGISNLTFSDIQDQGKKALEEKVKGLQNVIEDATTTIRDVNEKQDPPKIHSGFKNAYLSVNETLSAVIMSATNRRPQDWHIFVTGHSLGGALATLATLDLSRRQPGVTVTMYNYGSPRVGNRAFAELYDKYIGDSFRVVNDLDVVARLPRGTLTGLSLDYAHAGRTVMVTEDPADEIWVEGKSEGLCPLREADPQVSLAKGSTDFIDVEMKMLQTLFSGQGINHHMEHNYFGALGSLVIRAEDGIRV